MIKYQNMRYMTKNLLEVKSLKYTFKKEGKVEVERKELQKVRVFEHQCKIS